MKEKVMKDKLDAIGDQLKEIKRKFKIKPSKSRTDESERWVYYEKTFGYHEDFVTERVWKVNYDSGEIEEVILPRKCKK